MAASSQKRNPLPFVILISLLIAGTFAILVFLMGNLKKEMKGSAKNAEEFYLSGKPQEAIDELDRLPAEQRGTCNSLLWYGKSWYLSAWEDQEKNRWADYGRNSNDWFEGEMVDKAVHYLKRASLDTSCVTEATFYLALIYLQKGWYERSDEKFRELFSYDSKHRMGILNFGVLRSRSGDYRSAEKIFLKGLKLYPDEPEYYKNLFWIYDSHLKEYEKAVSYGDQYLKHAVKGDVGALRVRQELIDLLARFPEYRTDTLQIEQKKFPHFTPRKYKDRK